MKKKKVLIAKSHIDLKKKVKLYILDKAERDLFSAADYLYLCDPKQRGKEYVFNLIGIAHEGKDSQFRLITGIGYGKVISSFGHVINPADTLDAIDEQAKGKGLSIVGVAHLHPFPNGHEFLSGTDIRTMKAFGSMDHGHVFIVINPLTSEYSAYLWNNEKEKAVKTKLSVIRTTPIIIEEPMKEQSNIKSINQKNRKITDFLKDTSNSLERQTPDENQNEKYV